MTSRGKLIAIAGVVLCLSACDAYQPPPPPTVPTNPSASTVPVRIVLTASSRLDQQLDVAAHVLSSDGHAIPNVSVVFEIGDGTVEPQTTSTDQSGMARTLAISTAFTTITATIPGGIVASIEVLASQS